MFSHAWVSHVSGLGSRWNPQERRRVMAAAAVTVASLAVGGGAHLIARRRVAAAQTCCSSVTAAATAKPPTRLYLPLWLAQFAAGSFAECVQALVLYPLDTLKVNCQSSGQGSLATLRSIVRSYPGPNLLRYLYNGAGTMALASVFIGSVYYVAFKQSSILFARVFPARPPVATTQAAECEPQRSAPPGETSGGGGGAAAAEGDARADVCAAILASVCAGVIEGPIECVRNRVQAGVVQQHMLAYIFHGGGLAAALPFFIPHLLKTLPYDVAELVTYSAITKHIEARNINIPFSQEVQDALIGGVAGAAAVLASAPADCIKTRIVTMSPVMLESMSPHASTTQLWHAASRHIMRTQGIAGMFVGTLPRLVEKVPSTMMYWVAIEACARFLRQFTEEGAKEAAAAAAAADAAR